MSWFGETAKTKAINSMAMTRTGYHVILSGDTTYQNRRLPVFALPESSLFIISNRTISTVITSMPSLRAFLVNWSSIKTHSGYRRMLLRLWFTWIWQKLTTRCQAILPASDSSTRGKWIYYNSVYCWVCRLVWYAGHHQSSFDASGSGRLRLAPFIWSSRVIWSGQHSRSIVCGWFSEWTEKERISSRFLCTRSTS